MVNLFGFKEAVLLCVVKKKEFLIKPVSNDPDFKNPESQDFGKGESGDNWHFLPIPQCFLFYERDRSSLANI